ncbi:glycerol kinase GlpK [Colwelliaceae bacterium 6471]
MAAKYILAIDQGTTSSRAIIFDLNGKVIACNQQEFPQIFPSDGWVEHDPEIIWQSVKHTSQQVLEEAGISSSEIISLGITNQRETTLVWDKNTGKCIYNAIVWQDRRTSEQCKKLRNIVGLSEKVQSKTGLVLDPYFSATKIAWVLDNVEGARLKAEKGELLFGTIDTFLLFRLTNSMQHLTDATNASRTLLFNIHENRWDDELLSLFNIPLQMMPEVKDSAADFGVTDVNIFSPAISIGAMAGDQQAALVGQGCLSKGMMKSTYGTGCFMMVNTGDKVVQSAHQLLSTIAYRINGQTTYALEGSIFMAGATIQWIRDGLKFIDCASESEGLAQQIAYDHQVYMVPAFTGLGAPYWHAKARGTISGLTRDSGIKEIVSAALQSVGYQSRDLIMAMKKDGAHPHSIRVDGGMVANDWLMQFLADMLDFDVLRSREVETTALGVALLAGVHSGVYNGLDELKNIYKSDITFTPEMSDKQRQHLYQGWLGAVNAALNITEQ